MPSAGHSLVTLVSVPPLSSKEVIKKPEHDNLLWMKITVSEVSEASADIVWTGAQLRGHSSGAVGFVLRQLQAPGLLDIKQTRAACFPQVCV